jgi:hypothetical protein
MKQNKTMVYLSLAIFMLGIFSLSILLDKQTEIIFKDVSTESSLTSFNNIQISVIPFCGDGTCNYKRGENAMNCPEDCYV